METKKKLNWRNHKKSIAFILCIALIGVAILGSIPSMAGDPVPKENNNTSSAAIENEAPKQIIYSVDFVVDGEVILGTLAKSDNESEAASIRSDLIPSDPEKKDKKFEGWQADDKKLNPDEGYLGKSDIKDLNITKDTSFTAIFSDVNSSDEESNSSEPKQRAKTNMNLNDTVNNEDDEIFHSLFTVDAKGVITKFDAALYSGETTMTIPNKIDGKVITGIGSGSFKTLNESSISKIIMSDEITKIDASAFEACVGLKEIVFSKNLKSIGRNAFKNAGLVSANLKDTTLETIGQHSFSMTKVEAVTLPDTLKTIEAAAFYQTKIKEVKIPDSVETMGGQVFRACNLLEKAELGDGLKVINSLSFEGTKLKTLKLPAALEKIDVSAFSKGISTGVSIKIPETVKEIGAGAFNEMKECLIDLTAFTPGAIVGSPWGAYDTTVIKWKDDNTSCYYVNEDGYIVGIKPEGHTAASGETCSDPGTHGDKKDLVFPKEVINIDGTITQVKGIAPYTFQNNNKIRSIAFEPGSTITEIGPYTFNYCQYIEKIDLSNTNITKIGTFGFGDNRRVNNIIWSKTLKSIENSGFLRFVYNSKIDVVLPEGLEHIGDSAFGNSFMKSLKLPESLKTIGLKSFASCTHLKDVTIPKNTESIGQQAFMYCNIEKIYIKGSNPITIGTASFPTGRKLTDIYITERETNSIANYNIAWGAQFANIHWKNEIVDPLVVKSADGLWELNRVTNNIVSFNGNGKTYDTLTVPGIMTAESGSTYTAISMNQVGLNITAKHLVIDEGMKEIIHTGYFTKGSKIDKVTIAGSLTKLPNYTFSGCGINEVVFAPNSNLETIPVQAFINNNLTSIDFIPESVKVFGDNCFSNNKLEGDITVPLNITRIGKNVFSGNNGIENIYLSKNIATMDKESFNLIENLERVYVDKYRKDAKGIEQHAPFNTSKGGQVKAIFLGETPVSTISAIENVGPGRSITFAVETKAEYPNIANIYVGNKNNSIKPAGSFASTDSTNPFVIYKNGTYKIYVQNANGIYETEFTVDDIGTMNINAKNTSFSVLKGGNISKQDILTNSNVSAKDLDSGNTNSGISYEISDNDMDKVNQLKNTGESVDILIKATYKGSYPQGAKDVDGTDLSNNGYTNTTSTSINVKLSPESIKVFFDSKGGTFDTTERALTINNIEGVSLGGAEMPLNPEKAGHTFVNWTVSGASTVFDSSLLLKEDTYVNGNWNINTYNVKFDTNSGQGNIPSQKVTYKDFAKAPGKDATREGYIFDGWYEEALVPSSNLDQSKKWNFDTNEILKDTTLYAGWKTYEYTVTYDVNATDAAVIGPSKVMSPNKKVSGLPEEPKRTGYAFKEWNYDIKGEGESFTGDQEINKDITVYAQWKKVPTNEKTDNNKPTPVNPVGPTDPTGPTNPAEPSNPERVEGQSDNPQNITGEGPTDTVRSGSQIQNDSSVSGQVSDPRISGSSPSVNIGGNEVPLYGNTQDTWALINLVLAVAGAVLALLVLARTAYRKLRGKREEIHDDESRSEYGYKSNILWFIVTIISAIAGTVIFALTQDMSLKMVLFDTWTIVHALILLIEITAAVFVYKRKNETKYNQPAYK